MLRVRSTELPRHEATGLYQLLETIRQYATEQLALAGELEAIRDRHAFFYLKVGLREGGALMEGPERPHLEVLRRVEDNTRVALERLLTINPAEITFTATPSARCATNLPGFFGVGIQASGDESLFYVTDLSTATVFTNPFEDYAAIGRDNMLLFAATEPIPGDYLEYFRKLTGVTTGRSSTPRSSGSRHGR